MNDANLDDARKRSLAALLAADSPLDDVIAQVKSYTWDSKYALVALNAGDVIRVLDRYLASELTSEQVESWANAIENREDIEIARPIVREMLFQLANPSLNAPITEILARNMLESLRTDQRAE